MKSTRCAFGAFVLAAVAFATSNAGAVSEATKAKAERFRSTESTLQQESSNRPVVGPASSKAVPSADPLPKATTKQQRKERFAAQETQFQQQSRSSASGSPRVDRTSAASDPIPKATNKTEKKARFAAQEKQLQRESMP